MDPEFWLTQFWASMIKKKTMKTEILEKPIKMWMLPS